MEKRQQQLSLPSRQKSALLSSWTFVYTSLLLVSCSQAFTSPRCPHSLSSYHHHHQQRQQQPVFDLHVAKSGGTGGNDPAEIIAKRIYLEGDVDGGYYRSCVRNEASRFRNLSGTMTPPEDSKKAEIYVEGRRKMVESFCRWCKRSDVGLSQTITVSEVVDEDPTGLYDEFYVKMPSA